MRYLYLFIFLLSISPLDAQRMITFEELYENYDSSSHHQFQRHLFKNLKYSELYGQNGNHAIVEIKNIRGSWTVELKGSQYPNHDHIIADIAKEALEYLIVPDEDVSAMLRVKFEFVWRDNRKNTKDLSEWDIKVSRWERISCGPSQENHTSAPELDSLVSYGIKNQIIPK